MKKELEIILNLVKEDKISIEESIILIESYYEKIHSGNDLYYPPVIPSNQPYYPNTPVPIGDSPLSPYYPVYPGYPTIIYGTKYITNFKVTIPDLDFGNDI